MSDPLQHLVEALRKELQQYGETLALLDSDQDAHASCTGVHFVADTLSYLEQQRAAIEAAQEQRRICQAHLAWSFGDPAITTPEQLVQLSPEHYQPLLKALLAETKESLQRVRDRARHNQDQLQKIHRLMQQFIDGISDDATPTDRPATPLSQTASADLSPAASARIAS